MKLSCKLKAWKIVDMLNVSQYRGNIHWMALFTLVLSLVSVSSAQVIVEQSDISSAPITTTSPISTVENSTSRFQIVVKDYAEDDNRLAGASFASSRNETDTSDSTQQPPLLLVVAATTTKSPSEFKTNINSTIS